MRRDSDRRFTRRALLLGGGQAVLLSVLVARMYRLQVLEAERYATLADENRIDLRLVAPQRGLIYDRFGRSLATNLHDYRVLLVPERSRDIALTLSDLGLLVDLPAAEQQRVLRLVRRRRGYEPVTVLDGLSWRDVARVEVHAPELPGIDIDAGPIRHYPYADLTAHVLGYVSSVSKTEQSDDPVLYLPGFQIGKVGIEQAHEAALRGHPGSTEVEVNALGRPVRELRRRDGAPGRDVYLTLDIDLQEYATGRLGEQSAAVVLLDVHGGEVLALVSTPAYDPNAFARGMSHGQWKALLANPKAPLNNKAIAGLFPPGSTFKMVLALAGLEAGVIGPNDWVSCKGFMKFYDMRLHCWRRGGHGGVNLHKAISQSCDVYFYELARKLGIRRIGAMARRLGLGELPGIEIPGERAGTVPSKEWKLATLGETWKQGETLVAGIGQGFMLTTPLQLAVMTARLVNGGRAVTPRLTGAIVGPEGGRGLVSPEAPSIGLSPTSLELVHKAMDAVTNHPTGTAYRARILLPGMAMGGKTGTVQVRRITRAERRRGITRNQQRPWRHRDHALFLGFAPVDKPRYAVAVVVEHGGGGSAVAAPIARDILIETLRRDPLGEGLSEVAQVPAAGPEAD